MFSINHHSWRLELFSVKVTCECQKLCSSTPIFHLLLFRNSLKFKREKNPHWLICTFCPENNINLWLDCSFSKRMLQLRSVLKKVCVRVHRVSSQDLNCSCSLWQSHTSINQSLVLFLLCSLSHLCYLPSAFICQRLSLWSKTAAGPASCSHAPYLSNTTSTPVPADQPHWKHQDVFFLMTFHQSVTPREEALDIKPFTLTDFLWRCLRIGSTWTNPRLPAAAGR